MIFSKLPFSQLNLWKLLFAVLVLNLAACSSTRTVEQQVAAENDPLESINRPIWEFNWEVLDKHVLRPTAVAYVDYVPKFARVGLSNAANNLDEPSNALNNLLQGKFTDSFTSVFRFAVNSSFGLFGLVDVAAKAGIEAKDEEFGETLGTWGMGTGAYLMVPGMGPTDVRSATGDVVDSSYFPLSDLTFYTAFFKTAVSALEGRAALIEQEQLLYDAVDSYSMIKNVYFQNLNNNLYDGNPPEPEVDEEEDEELDALLDDF